MSARFSPGRPRRVRLPVMHQNWDRIAFLHWPIDRVVLQSRLPAGLVVDTFQNHGWVGLTPFHLTGLRPPWLPPLPWLSHFPEMNLRTYVRGPAGAGIWFFSLDAASVVAVLAARVSYGLPYHWSAMSVRIHGNRLRYLSARAGVTAAITVEVGEPLTTPDDLALFLTERYRLYTRLWRRLAVAEVEHEPWPLRQAELVSLEETVRRAANLPESGALPIAHYSAGVRVRVGAPRRLPPIAGSEDASAWHSRCSES